MATKKSNSKTNETKNSLLAIIRKRNFSNADRSSSLARIYRHMLTNSRFVKAGNFKDICNADLGMLFQVTDEHFFEGLLGQLCEIQADRPLTFRLSTRMTSSGGMTTMQSTSERRKKRTEFEIAIATTPLFATFRDDPSAVVSGVKCHDRLEALQRIMEHEMVHLAEMLLWNDSNCAAQPFKGIVNRFFGHTESNHQLLTPRDIARRKLGISAGDLVTFVMDSRQLQGHVNRITKRATVLVQDPQGVLYDDGQKYLKYYVPIHHLSRVRPARGKSA